MPTYTYRCDTCGHGFEAVQRFADDPLTECPECGAPIRRVIQPVGVVFKGSGWYINDSRKSSGAKNSSESSSSTESSESTTKTDKTETKSASDKTPTAASASAKSD